MLPLLGLIKPVLDKILPDKAAREAAELKLAELEQAGEFKAIEVQLSAIIAEAQSQDKWTSRARPSFLYVIYTLLLWGIPMGIIAAFWPDRAQAIALGFKAWLDAIPGELYALFGVGYLGYVGSRSYDKKKILEVRK